MTDPSPPPRRAAAVPTGRTRRFMHLGRAVGELAMAAAADGLSRLARGQRPDISQLLLTPANARRLAERLSQMRGAAMKVGQLMSMDGKGVLPAQFAELLGGLRDHAHTMPATQLAAVLASEYGAQWRARFRHFGDEPIAAASIGQVHRAETRDGRVLALKIQYPGVRDSIASDMANLALLARIPGLMPGELDPAPLLARVRKQLYQETDYRAEALALTDYRKRLGADPMFSVPAVHEDFSTAHILATDFATGVPIDHLAQGHRPQSDRDRVATALCRLTVRELFEWRLVQTDPNFGNYLYEAATGRVALLDFGATQSVPIRRVAHLRSLFRAMRSGDVPRMLKAAQQAGFIAADDSPAQLQGITELMALSGEPLRHRGTYDFAVSDLFSRIYERGQAQYFGDGFSRTPPPDLIFLQRKLIGLFMLCTRLRARVDIAALLGEHL